MAKADYDTGAEASGGEAVSTADPLFRQLTGWYKEDVSHANKWRKGAKEDFRFVAGKSDKDEHGQWEEDDAKTLKDQRRPFIEWNRVAPLVNAVVGSEINNRREVRYFPREQGDAKANEVLTAAAEWFRDQAGTEDEETDAFKSQVVCGMGWTDTRLDFSENPDGAPVTEKIDAMEMVWDRNAVKPNLIDAQRLFRVRETTYRDAEDLTGESDPAKLHAGWAKMGDTSGPHDQDASDRYDGTQSENDLPKKCVLVEARWLEKEVFYRGPDLQNEGQIKEYDERQLKAMNELLKKEGQPPFPAIKQTRKVVKRVFIGSEILGKPDKIMAPAGMFGWECITGYKDELSNQWYGIVRPAKDPQRWTNKFFSQVQYLLNSQSKGGIIAERGAFENDSQAEQSLTRTDIITWAKTGALSGEKPKIIPKNPAQFPAGFFTLFQEAKEGINDVTGLSMEFIGTREVDQAGVLEYQRKQSSLNLLAELFNSLRRYRKRQGRVLLYLIQNHLADGRLIRIVGDGLTQYVPLTKEQIASSEYDVIVDDSPSSPNEKDRTWQLLMQLLPMVKDMLTPEIAMELLAISPLPASLVEQLKNKAKEAAAQPKPPTPEEQKIAGEREKHQMDMAGKAADLQAKQTENEMDVQMKGIDLMVKAKEAEMDQQAAQQKLQVDMQRAAVQERQNAIAAQGAAAKRTSAAKG